MQYFNNKVYIEPNSAVKIVTSIPPSPNLISTGTVVVLGESTGGLTAADKTVYSSNDPNFFNTLLIGGVGLRCVNYVFNPSIQYPGANKVIFIRTQAATVATLSITQAGPSPAAATMVITTKDKGSYLSDVTNGYMWKVVAGILNSSANIFMLQYNGNLFWTSPECLTYQDFLNAVAANQTINNIISCAMTVGTAATAIATTARVGTYTVMTGGTISTMTGSDVDAALALTTTLGADIYFIASETNTNHAKVAAFVNNTSEAKAISFVGGAANETKAQVLVRSAALNVENCSLCYPDITMPTLDGLTTESLSSMYFAAICAGLAAGLPAFQPLTYKTVNVLGFNPYEGALTQTDRENLINGGVLVGRNIPGIGNGINKGVNTLQTNASMIYKDTLGNATSPEISVIRIKYQLMMELQLNAKSLFLGGTAATVTKEDVLNFTNAYLNTRTSTTTQPNLIMSFKDVTAQLVSDGWFVWFGFVPNTPINFVFFTGTMLLS